MADPSAARPVAADPDAAAHGVVLDIDWDTIESDNDDEAALLLIERVNAEDEANKSLETGEIPQTDEERSQAAERDRETRRKEEEDNARRKEEEQRKKEEQQKKEEEKAMNGNAFPSSETHDAALVPGGPSDDMPRWAHKKKKRKEKDSSRFTCDLCNGITMVGEKSRDTHLRGKKHLTRARQARLKEKNEELNAHGTLIADKQAMRIQTPQTDPDSSFVHRDPTARERASSSNPQAHQRDFASRSEERDPRARGAQDRNPRSSPNVPQHPPRPSFEHRSTDSRPRYFDAMVTPDPRPSPPRVSNGMLPDLDPSESNPDLGRDSPSSPVAPRRGTEHGTDELRNGANRSGLPREYAVTAPRPAPDSGRSPSIRPVTPDTSSGVGEKPVERDAGPAAASRATNRFVATGKSPFLPTGPRRRAEKAPASDPGDRKKPVVDDVALAVKGQVLGTGAAAKLAASPNADATGVVVKNGHMGTGVVSAAMKEDPKAGTVDARDAAREGKRPTAASGPHISGTASKPVLKEGPRSDASDAMDVVGNGKEPTTHSGSGSSSTVAKSVVERKDLDGASALKSPIVKDKASADPRRLISKDADRNPSPRNKSREELKLGTSEAGKVSQVDSTTVKEGGGKNPETSGSVGMRTDRRLSDDDRRRETEERRPGPGDKRGVADQKRSVDQVSGEIRRREERGSISEGKSTTLRDVRVSGGDDRGRSSRDDDRGRSSRDERETPPYNRSSYCDDRRSPPNNDSARRRDDRPQRSRPSDREDSREERRSPPYDRGGYREERRSPSNGNGAREDRRTAAYDRSVPREEVVSPPYDTASTREHRKTSPMEGGDSREGSRSPSIENSGSLDKRKSRSEDRSVGSGDGKRGRFDSRADGYGDTRRSSRDDRDSRSDERRRSVDYRDSADRDWRGAVTPAPPPAREKYVADKEWSGRGSPPAAYGREAPPPPPVLKLRSQAVPLKPEEDASGKKRRFTSAPDTRREEETRFKTVSDRPRSTYPGEAQARYEVSHDGSQRRKLFETTESESQRRESYSGKPEAFNPEDYPTVPEDYLKEPMSVAEWRELRHHVLNHGSAVDKLAYKMMQEIILSPVLGINDTSLAPFSRAMSAVKNHYVTPDGIFAKLSDYPKGLTTLDPKYSSLEKEDEDWSRYQTKEYLALCQVRDNIEFTFNTNENPEKKEMVLRSDFPTRGSFGIRNQRKGPGVVNDGERPPRYEDSVAEDPLFKSIMNYLEGQSGHI